jgi:citrate lyase subunit beta/citryl-CoA lyase
VGAVTVSYLYVPGNAPEGLAAAFDSGADAVVVDLADAVPPETKDDTRAAVAQWLRDQWLRDQPQDRDLWVCINPGPMGHEDARQVVGPWLRGVCLAKTESTTQLDALDAVLSTVETEAGIGSRTIAVVPLLESATAILAAPAIARSQRVARLQIAEIDLRAELGLELSPDERELLWIRSQVVVAGASAGLAAPIAAASLQFTDPDRLRETTTALKRLGFGSRACIHPAQIPTVNEVFA